jgi:hypothetical protein
MYMYINFFILGFPTVDKQQIPNGPWVVGFKRAIEVILTMTEQFKNIAVIRDAVSIHVDR